MTIIPKSHEFHLTAGAFGGKVGRGWHRIRLHARLAKIVFDYYECQPGKRKTGSVKDLDKFFIALGFTGTWSQPTAGDGHLTHLQIDSGCSPALGSVPRKKSLLIQG